jgi:hypothetical protein
MFRVESTEGIDVSSSSVLMRRRFRGLTALASASWFGGRSAEEAMYDADLLDLLESVIARKPGYLDDKRPRIM